MREMLGFGTATCWQSVTLNAMSALRVRHKGATGICFWAPFLLTLWWPRHPQGFGQSCVLVCTLPMLTCLLAVVCLRHAL